MQEEGHPFPPHIESTCVAVLKACHLRTGLLLDRFMTTRRFGRDVESFAASYRISLSEVSHLDLVVIAISLRSRRIFLLFIFCLTMWCEGGIPRQCKA